MAKVVDIWGATVKEYDNEDEARAYVDMMNAHISPGQRLMYGDAILLHIETAE